jgi:acetylornithine/N-succinyldiaminopimelate aminotransferase
LRLGVSSEPKPAKPKLTSQSTERIMTVLTAGPATAPKTDSESLMEITNRPDTVMVRGEGSWLWDDAGRRYLDFVQGWAVNALGHSPVVVQEALARQSARLLTPSPAFHNAPQLALARALADCCTLDRVFFCNSGAEANEGAIKLARKWGRQHRQGAWQIVTTHGGFHGRTLATMAASGKPGWDEIFAPATPGFRKVPFGDAGAVSRALGPDVAAVLVEPIQGEAGVVVPPPGYLRDLRDLTSRQGVLLIVDEVQTGMGRTGPLFAHQQAGIDPDVMTLGKGLGGGVPLAALLAREEVCCFAPGDQGGTFNGNPLMTAVGLAVLEAITEPGFVAARARVARQLATGLEDLARSHGCLGTRGAGFLLALRLPAPAGPAIVADCAARGLLLNSPRPELLRLMPSLAVSEEEVREMLSILGASLSEVLPRL